jgi:3-methyladenine DNA glycosylase Tag
MSNIAATNSNDPGSLAMPATPFVTILDQARTRHGAAALDARLPQPKSASELSGTSDDRYLSQMSLRIFRAGLKHSVVDAKWPVFEEVFAGFDPRRVRAMSDENLEKLLSDARLIRHWGKLKSIRDNAAAMLAVSEEFGSFGAWIGTWPDANIVRLWDALSDRFSQMGGNSGPMFLRMVGKDTFVLSNSVVAGLKRWADMPKPPKNRAERAAAQACFNAWAAETGRPLSQLSLILALSVDE